MIVINVAILSQSFVEKNLHKNVIDVTVITIRDFNNRDIVITVVVAHGFFLKKKNCDICT